MKRRYLTNMIVRVCLFTQVFLCGGTVPGLVLCVANDGHVTVEFAHEGRACSTDYDRHHGSALAGDDRHDRPHGGDTEHAHVDGKHLTPAPHDCTDTPLLHAPAQLTARSTQPSTLPPSVLVRPIPLEVAPVLHSARAGIHPPPPTPSSSLRRTIVLRV
jgi:hypothetical protein